MRCLSTFLFWIHTLFISIQRNEVFIYLFVLNTYAIHKYTKKWGVYLLFVLNTYAMHKHTKKWGVYLLFCTEYIRYAYVYKEMRCLSTFLYWIHTLCISIQRNGVFINFFVLDTYAMHKHTKKWGVYLLVCTKYIHYA